MKILIAGATLGLLLDSLVGAQQNQFHQRVIEMADSKSDALKGVVFNEDGWALIQRV